MKKTFMSTVLAMLMCLVLVFGLVACDSQKQAADPTEAPVADAEPAVEAEAEDAEAAVADEAEKAEEAEAEQAGSPELPGESGFLEIEIGDLQIAGPFQVQLVYFQGVDMIPAGKQPSADESDMHLEADIHLLPEFAPQFGFGAGEDIWPAYLTVDYKVLSEDGQTEITSGSMMPMNADDGPHYGINIKKGLIPVGKYQIVLEFRPSDDYLLHVDSETGVPLARTEGLDATSTYYEQQTVTVEWNYTGEQLENK
ncbi:MAG: iron transporter [Eubacteriales bacterium]|nr:iron transporter [Eubacteriales bacterium]